MATSKDDRERRGREDHYRHAALAHPLRQGILHLMLGGMEGSAIEIAAELAEVPGRIAHHLHVLRRRGVVRGIAKDPPAPPHFRLAPGVPWARKMLAEFDKEDRDNNQGGRK